VSKAELDFTNSGKFEKYFLEHLKYQADETSMIINANPAALV
jgi:hypothetical protein